MHLEQSQQFLKNCLFYYRFKYFVSSVRIKMSFMVDCVKNTPTSTIHSSQPSAQQEFFHWAMRWTYAKISEDVRNYIMSSLNYQLILFAIDATVINHHQFTF